MRSYAQNFEDAILWQALADVRLGFYVDVGAEGPEVNSVTKLFYDLGWHGINIEPNGQHFALLAAQRPRDINLNVAAGPTNGTGTFYHYDRGVGFVANKPQIRQIFESHGHKGHEATLGQATLNQILADHPPPDQGQIHFLKIDAEGYEPEILAGLDLKRYRPWIIVAEASLPAGGSRVDQVWSPLVLQNHYAFVYFDGLNCYFIATERAQALKTSWASLK